MNRAPFSSFPPTIRLGIVCTVAGWCFFILSQAAITSTLSLLPITIALVCGVMVYSQKVFARYFCAIASLLMAAGGVYALYGLFSAAPLDARPFLPASVRLVQVLLFSAAAYFLLKKESAVFYRQN